MPNKILIIHKTADYYAGVLAPRHPEAEIVAVPEDVHASHSMPAAALEHAADATAIVTIGRWVNGDTIAPFRNLRWLQCLITGTDHLEPHLRDGGTMLTNAWGIHGPQMAEIAILHRLAHTRQIGRLVRAQSNHKWDRFTPRVLHGRTAAIIGVGAIAEAVAKLCKAFGMTTIGVTRTPRSVEGFDRVEPRDRLIDVVAEADYVIVLLPLTDENRQVIGADVIGAMKPEAALINISRGGVVDETAMIAALRERRIAFAGLDVFQTLPLSPDSPLWEMDNVFITPQVGGQSDRYDEAAVWIVDENIGHFVRGETDQMINVVLPGRHTRSVTASS